MFQDLLKGIEYLEIENYKFRLSNKEYYVDKEAQRSYYKKFGANYSLYDFMPEFNIDIQYFLNAIHQNIINLGMYVYKKFNQKGSCKLIAINTNNHIEIQIKLQSEFIHIDGKSVYNGSNDAQMIVLSIEILKIENELNFQLVHNEKQQPQCQPFAYKKLLSYLHAQMF